MRRLNSILEVISKDNMKNELFGLMEFDGDVVGENGDEFTLDEALKSGYKTSADYFIDLAINEYGESVEAIKKSLEYVLESQYYAEEEVQVIERENEYIVSVAYIIIH